MNNARNAAAIILFAALPVLGFTAYFSQQEAQENVTLVTDVAKSAAQAMEEGERVTLNIPVQAFSAIKLDVPAELELRQGESTSLVAKGTQEQIDRLELRYEGQVLVIDKKTRKWLDVNTESLQLTLTLGPELLLSSITNDGSGRIYSAVRWQQDQLKVTQEGGGSIQLKVKADRLEAVLDGSGDLELEVALGRLQADIDGSGTLLATGKANYTTLFLDGSGDLLGRNYTTENLVAIISGSGNVSDIVIGLSLDAKLEGSGGIQYYGDPATKDVKAEGSGAVKRLGPAPTPARGPASE